MSTGFLKKPNRLPPPPPAYDPKPPSDYDLRPQKSCRKIKNDYIKISDCHTGTAKPMCYKSRTSTSFSSTLKALPPAHAHSSHQKSRSLTEGIGSSYLSLDLPSVANKTAPDSSFIDYNQVDFLRTEALNRLKVERNEGRN